MRALIFLALLGLAAAALKNPQRIVGGTPTVVDNYPYMANMQYFLNGIRWVQQCGGSLINARSVVSAGHCYFGHRAYEWRVRLGTSLPTSGGDVYTVIWMRLHEMYFHGTLANDIAIVRLNSNAIFSDRVAPVSIAGTNYNLPDGTAVTAIGWGVLSYGGAAPDHLQHVDINIVNWDWCRDQYVRLKEAPGLVHLPNLTENMLCAGIQHVGGKDACQGDSGGPLVHRSSSSDVLVGIVSWGYRCADPNYPGVSTNVNKYSDWIVANA